MEKKGRLEEGRVPGGEGRPHFSLHLQEYREPSTAFLGPSPGEQPEAALQIQQRFDHYNS